MLRQISFKNYKAFKARQTIDLKPRTILVGPNSAGKSSIIKLIGLLKQSVMAKEPSHDILQFNGPEVQAKSFENLSHNHKSDPIEVSFINDIYRQGIIEPESELGYWSSIPEEANIVREKVNFYLKSSAELKKDHIHVDYFKGSKGKYSNLETFYGNYALTLKKNIKLIEKLTKAILNDLSPMIDYCISNNCVNVRPVIRMKLVDSGKELLPVPMKDPTAHEQINAQIQGIIKVTGEIDYEWEGRSFVPFQIEHTRKINVGFVYTEFNDKVDFEAFPDFEGIHYKTPSEYLQYSYKDLLNKIKEHWSSITSDPDLSNAKVRENIEAQLYKYAKVITDWTYVKNQDIFIRSEKNIDLIKLSLKTTFERINFFPALRPGPKDYYTEKELNENFGITPKYFEAEKYTSAFNALGYNYEIILEKLSKGHDIYALYFKDPLSNIYVTLPEMGYGFSQVLPYISRYGALNILEQPELHLHPKAQAAFPSILSKSTNYIIETHSEHILRGIQIDVAKGNLEKDDIAVYYVGKHRNGNSYVKEMEMTETGLFNEAWPGGLFEDAFNQSRELLKYQ